MSGNFLVKYKVAQCSAAVRVDASKTFLRGGGEARFLMRHLPFRPSALTPFPFTLTVNPHFSPFSSPPVPQLSAHSSLNPLSLSSFSSQPFFAPPEHSAFIPSLSSHDLFHCFCVSLSLCLMSVFLCFISPLTSCLTISVYLTSALSQVSNTSPFFHSQHFPLTGPHYLQCFTSLPP